MAVTEPPKDSPFGLEPNVAAGLAYLFSLIGGIVMLVGGGSNKFVKWSAAQSIVLSVVIWLLFMIVSFGMVLSGFIPFFGWLVMLGWGVLSLLSIGLWLWTTITGFQGQSVRVPLIADLTEKVFKSVL